MLEQEHFSEWKLSTKETPRKSGSCPPPDNGAKKLRNLLPNVYTVIFYCFQSSTYTINVKIKLVLVCTASDLAF